MDYQNQGKLEERQNSLSKGGTAVNNASGTQPGRIPLLSPIRTLTVGSGITPDLLTSRRTWRERSRAFSTNLLIYRRWGLSPRPENKHNDYNAND